MSVQQRIRGTQPEVQADGKVKVVIGESVAKKLGADVWGWHATFGLGLFCAVVMFFFSYFYPIESELDKRAGSLWLAVGIGGLLILLPCAAIGWYRYAWAGQKLWWFPSNVTVYLGSATKGYPNSTDGLTVFVHARKYFPRVQFFWGSAGWHFVKVAGRASENSKSYFSDYAGTRQILKTDWQALEGFGLTKDIQMLLVSSVFFFSREDWRVETPCGGTILRFVSRRSSVSRAGNEGVVITIAPHDFGLLPEVISHLCYDNYEGYRNAQRAELLRAQGDLAASYMLMEHLASTCYQRSFQKAKGSDGRANARIRDLHIALRIYEHLATRLPEHHILRSVQRGTAVLDAAGVVVQIREVLNDLRAARGSESVAQDEAVGVTPAP